MRLPKDYKAFLSISNGLEDFIGDAYFRLYRVEELQQVNLDYNTQESAPGLFMIGSNGGGETYSYNTNKHMKLYLVPFIVYIHEDALYIAQNFLHLLRRCINREDLFETKYWLPKNHH